MNFLGNNELKSCMSELLRPQQALHTPNFLCLSEPKPSVYVYLGKLKFIFPQGRTRKKPLIKPWGVEKLYVRLVFMQFSGHKNPNPIKWDQTDLNCESGSRLICFFPTRHSWCDVGERWKLKFTQDLFQLLLERSSR